MLSAEFLEAAKTMVILTTFWAIIVLDIWAIGSMITHFIMWVYKGIKKLSKKKNLPVRSGCGDCPAASTCSLSGKGGCE